MSKPKNMTPEQEVAWKDKVRKQNRERNRKWSKANPEKVRERIRKWKEANPEKLLKHKRKYYYKARNQAAADQFFILSAAAQQISDIQITK